MQRVVDFSLRDPPAVLAHPLTDLVGIQPANGKGFENFPLKAMRMRLNRLCAHLIPRISWLISSAVASPLTIRLTIG